MTKKRFSLQAFPLQDKTALLRVDYNVPLEKGGILDLRKIKASLPTIHFLQQHRCKIIIATHLGRPEGKVNRQWSTRPLAEELQKLLPHSKVRWLPDCLGLKVRQPLQQSKPGDIFLLENLRFYQEEENDDPCFAHLLASLADVVINDAFAVCHRTHASIHAIAKYAPLIPGLLVEKELQHLHQALHPRRPSIWIIGGAKLDKIELLEQALQKADHVLLGGALPFSFLRAKGIPIGMSRVDAAHIPLAKKLLRHPAAKKLVFPVDYAVAEHFTPRAPSRVIAWNEFQSRDMGLDIGPETIRLYKSYLRKAQTIVWNGPLGYFEWAAFAQGTKEIGRFIGKSAAISIAGGGETEEALSKFQLLHHFTHVSTGGGAFLSFLSGKRLPGLDAFEESYRKFGKKREKQ